MTWLNNAEIKTAEDKATEAKEQARQAAKAKRDAALNSLTYTFEDGRVIQTRPQDLSLIEMGIALGGDDWVLADNTVAKMTKSDLEEAKKAGIKAGKEVWKEYKKALKND